jgi:hypothetical protein
MLEPCPLDLACGLAGQASPAKRRGFESNKKRQRQDFPLNADDLAALQTVKGGSRRRAVR